MTVRATVVIPRHVRDAAAVTTNLGCPPTTNRWTLPQDQHRRESFVQHRRELSAFTVITTSDRSYDNLLQCGMHGPSPQLRDLPTGPAEQQGETFGASKHARLIVLGVVRQPRLLFQGWKPRLVDSPAWVARKTLERFLTSQRFSPTRCYSPAFADTNADDRDENNTSLTGRTSGDSSSQTNHADISDRVYHRTLRLFGRRSQQEQGGHERVQVRPTSVTVWIQPDHESTLLETSWESRLIRWENQLVKAQTAAGFLSTLGGAYFMCHHLTSAFVLAQQQRRLALVLNDPTMYYKCCVNQAYNLIYGGRFRFAHRLLRQVEKRVRDHAAHELGEESRAIILNMCQSARLFGKRVEKAAAVLGTANLPTNQKPRVAVDTSLASVNDVSPEDLPAPKTTPAIGSHGPKSKVVDDLARIRVYQDESRWQDMVRPFQRLSS